MNLQRTALWLALILTGISTAFGADSPFAGHPAADQLGRVFAAQSGSSDFKSTGLTRRDYLPLMAGDIEYWTKYQNDAGAIIDPYENAECQYSTPTFALAAALLATEDGRSDLLEPATRAMDWAVTSLAAGKAANGHADFFMPSLIHARRLLKDHVSPEKLADWDKKLKSVVPEKIYNMGLKGMNWNIVSSSGELLRREDGLVAADQLDLQMAYLNERLADHASRYFTEFGMYDDPGGPLAYDEFPRLWLDDMMSNDAYTGPTAPRLRELLRRGGLSSLLLLSPSGEWPNGGRSSHHNWTEAETIAIGEIHASQWEKAGHPEIAGAFKRAAHLAFQSMQRWVRPSGELWIIKNRYEPDKRFAFERYSNHSQYNTLPMAMLAMAYEHADDSIAERPAPAEVGGYVFDLREPFHKIIAAAGGYYIEIDTAADPHYNATGLQRIHRSGVEFPPLSDSTVAHRDYGAKDGPGATMSLGIQWKIKGSTGDSWESLANATVPDEKKPPASQPGAVRDVQLKINSISPARVSLVVTWTIVGAPADRKVSEQYTITASGVDCVSQVLADQVTATRICLPALLFDGIENSKITMADHSATILHRGSLLAWKLDSKAATPRLDGPEVPCHTGMVQALVADLPNANPEVHWVIQLSQSSQPRNDK